MVTKTGIYNKTYQIYSNLAHTTLFMYSRYVIKLKQEVLINLVLISSSIDNNWSNKHC